MGERKLKFQDRWMFNRVLCEEEVCRKVLRAALGIEAGEIANPNAEQCFEPLAAGRGVRLDVFARGDGRVYDIEMQVARERDLGRRMRYYQAAMDVGELGSGEDFGALPESYVLFFCRHDAYGKGEPVVRDRAQVWGPSRPCCGRRLPVGSAERLGVGGLRRPRAAGCATIPPDRGGRRALVVGDRRPGRRVQRGQGVGGPRAYLRAGDRDALPKGARRAVRKVERKREEGREEGEARLAVLVGALLADGRSEDVAAAVEDKVRREELYAELGI